MLLSDDFLIILKYSKDKTVYNILRSQLNTNFIFDVVTRVTELDMDLSSFCMPSQSEAISIDMLFNVLDTLSQLAKIE